MVVSIVHISDPQVAPSTADLLDSDASEAHSTHKEETIPFGLGLEVAAGRMFRVLFPLKQRNQLLCSIDSEMKTILWDQERILIPVHWVVLGQDILEMEIAMDVYVMPCDCLPSSLRLSE